MFLIIHFILFGFSRAQNSSSTISSAENNSAEFLSTKILVKPNSTNATKFYSTENFTMVTFPSNSSSAGSSTSFGITDYATTQQINNNATTSNYSTENSLSTPTNKFISSNTTKSLFFCEKGEEMRVCAFCERTCRHPFEFCGMANCFLPPKCYCKMGHVRDKNRKCIPTDQCPNECCFGSECVPCGNGFGCVVRNGQPKCVLDSHIVCNIRCSNGYQCIVRNGRPICEIN